MIDVAGIDLDPQTRCAHYHSALDVVAIKMKCCDTYYACKACHEALADHAIVVWQRAEWQTRAVLCGVCATEISIASYIDGSNRCGQCNAAFNPACREHHHFYFAQPPQ